jgi:hypothetical protein
MHKVHSSEKEVAAVRLYLDESGTRDPNTPQAVVGGMLINYSHFLHFEESWDELLAEFEIKPPLHVKEFTPHGRFAHINPETRRYLFAKVVELIDSHKIASLAATLTNAEYEQYVAKEIRDRFSVYAMCFNLVVMMNHKLAEGRYVGRIPFILDSGNPYAEHVRGAHAGALECQREQFLHVGGLFFEDDANLGVLQAADIIAWGVRRRASNRHFPNGLEPIACIFDSGHNENIWKPEWLKTLGEGLLRELTAKQAMMSKETNEEEF